MRKGLLILLIMALLAVAGFGQVPDYYQVEQAFKDFSSGVATSLPYASTLGLNWSKSYMGGFPHFGVGLSLGTIIVPLAEFQNVADTFGITIPSDYATIGGIPLPAYSLEGRIGGFLLPFEWDLGLKFGVMPEELAQQLASRGVFADFTLFGFDFRVPLVKENLLLPTISVGVGYNYLAGGVGMTGLFSSDQSITIPTEIQTAMTSLGYSAINTLTVTAPELKYLWQSHAIDLKLQVSKNILWLLTPYLGLGLTYGMSEAGGGLFSKVLADGTPITQTQIDQINDAFSKLGHPVPELSDTGIYVGNNVNGWSMRVYGGTSVNFLFLRVDVTAMYNLLSQGLGASLNARIQF